MSAASPIEAVSASLAFENIHHRFGPKRATLSGVSLEAEAGQVLCLLGPSGSGKTTLLRIAAGMEPQTGGRVLLNGQEIAGPSLFLPPEKRSIGFVFQDFALFPHLSVLENVRFGLHRLSREEGRRAARAALARVGMERYADSYPHVLSGGEQQRVALARTLAPKPAVILLDEPFSGLDARLKDSVRTETLATLRDARATAIVVTHDAEEAMRMGDRIALLRDGRLVQAGRAEDLYLAPADLFVASFFSELNLFRTRVSGGRAQTPVGSFAAKGLAEGAQATVAVRLSGFTVSGSGGVEARILSRRYLGAIELMELAIEGLPTPVRARLPCGAALPGDGRIRVSVRETDAVVFETQPENA